jgi:diguanylate cyclase (GGDEF)-like protein
VSSDLDDSQFFEHAPVSLWLEDFSAIKALFDAWRAEGVSDVEAHLRDHPAALEASAAAIRVLAVNRHTLQLFKARDLLHLAANLDQVLRPDMYEVHARNMTALWAGHTAFSSEGHHYTLEGERIEVLVKARIVPSHESDWRRVVVTLEDISSRMRTEQRLKDSEHYARSLFEHSPMSLWIEDFSGIRSLFEAQRAAGLTDFRTFVAANPAFVAECTRAIQIVDINQATLRMHGARDKREVLDNLGLIFRDKMLSHFAEQLVELWEGRTTMQCETINYTLSGQELNLYLQGSVLPGYEETWTRVLVSLTDITARKQAEAYLQYVGRHDQLTKLANRAHFDEVLKQAQEGPFPISIIIADMNGLKVVNDCQGHAAGDDLLRRAGETLRKAMGEEPCIARIGGDEFAILLKGVNEVEAQAAIERVEHMTGLNNQFHTGPRLSFAIGTGTALDAAALQRAQHQADAAMYTAKRAHYLQLGRDRRA